LDEDLEMGTSSDPGDQNEQVGELPDAPPAPPLEIGEEEDSGILDLPRKHYPHAAVPNVCAICLDAYKPDDTVVWSSNIDCSHAFHQDCILDYLVKLKAWVKDTVPCPCCRQDFMGLASEADEKGATSDTEELDVIVVGDTANMVSENV
jgi:hypothetical protein